MSKARELYPEHFEDEDGWLCIGSYQPIIDDIGTVIIQVDDEDYQGDTRVFYEGYGYLQFGWGSCSGCDMLQACETEEEVNDVIREIEGGVQWFLNADEALTYFKTHDWEGDYSWHQDEQKEFIRKVIEYLENIK